MSGLERVVVTGVGVVSSIGTGKTEFWHNLLAGKNGISPITSFDTSDTANQVGGEIRNFDPSTYLSEQNLKKYGRASQFAVAAAKLAVEDSDIDDENEIIREADVIVGTTMGEIQALESADVIWIQSSEEEVSGRLVSQYPSNNLAMSVASELNTKGLSIVIPTACAAGNYAIGYGFDLIRTGKSSLVIAGGAEAFSRIAYTGFSRMFAMAKNKCAPFDKKREGMLLGEGSGFLLLESMKSARKRGARIYAEIGGYGLSCDASHMTIPNEAGVVEAIKKAMTSSNVNPDEVDYISAHGTGTVANDKTECSAIHKVFAKRASHIPVSSIKSMIGHAMGAASALEAITCVLAIKESKIPPTINFENLDQDCQIDCVPNTFREKKTKVALNNSFAFGGNNSCVVFKKMD